MTGIIAPLPTVVGLSHSAVSHGPMRVFGHSGLPVSVGGVAPIRPRTPKVPVQSDPLPCLEIMDLVHQAVLLQVPYAGQVCVMFPAVRLGIPPTLNFWDEDDI